MRRAMASGQSKREHEWGDMAAVLEAMSGAVGQCGKSNPRTAGRFLSRRPRTGPGGPANWLSVPMAAANRAGPYTRALNL